MSTPIILRAAMLAAAAGLAGCTTMLLPPNVTPVVAPTNSVAEAERKVAGVAAQTAAIEAQFAASEQACYEKFFVNNCLDEAKERRRSALAYQKAVEVEAQYFRRRATADERDREVAKAVAQFNAEEARAAAQPAPAPPREAKPPKAGRPSLKERQDAQAARLAERAARERAEAPKRAASAREYEQRRIESEQRQKEVAAKVAEREAKKAADDAAPAKK